MSLFSSLPSSKYRSRGSPRSRTAEGGLPALQPPGPEGADGAPGARPQPHGAGGRVSAAQRRPPRRSASPSSELGEPLRRPEGTRESPQRGAEGSGFRSLPARRRPGFPLALPCGLLAAIAVVVAAAGSLPLTSHRRRSRLSVARPGPAGGGGAAAAEGSAGPAAG